MGNGAERNDDFQLLHGSQFGLEMSVTLANLRRGRLVGGWQATHGIGNPAIGQLYGWIGKSIRPERFGGTGKAEAMQGGVQQLACNISGKRPASTIRTFFAGTKAEHQELRIKRAESGNGKRMPGGIAQANVGQMLSQAWASHAILGVIKYRHGGDVSMMNMQLNWDIFCRVIDNYGDIGVCWRLARQLANEHGKQVRLWVDDLHSLLPLCPDIDATRATQTIQKVEICHWSQAVAVDRVGEVIIEGFACELPAAYLAAMAQTARKPCWINLEYLTAETWADEYHGMASPHPSLPLIKYFFFPGFSSTTGGLLREKDLLTVRDMEISRSTRRDTLEISLFCYDSAPVSELLEILAGSPRPVCLHVAPGKPLAAVAAHFGGHAPWRRGTLEVRPFDFLPLDDFDRLLWRCDINFVRGEDSFVRAQWAARPFVWQVYWQQDEAHLIKLDAFLERYTAGLSAAGSSAAVDLFQAWNSGHGLRQAWERFLLAQSEIALHNRRWAEHLAGNTDLAEALVKFCASKV